MATSKTENFLFTFIVLGLFPSDTFLQDKDGQQKVDTTLGVYPNTDTKYLTEFSEVSGAEKKSIRWM